MATSRFSTLRNTASRLFAPLLKWVMTAPRAVSILALVVTAIAAIHLLTRCIPVYWSDLTEPVEEGQEYLAIYHYIMKSVFFWMWMLLPVLLVAILRSPNEGPPFRAAAVGSAIVFTVWVASEITTHGASNLELAGVEASPLGSVFRLLLIGALILSPPFLVWLYSRSKLLTQYVLRQFLMPFGYCFVGFIAIWLVIDLSDNGPDFFDAANATVGGVVKYYVVQIPNIIVLILPITLLLALLYSLGKMSKSNEIISMLTAGKSLTKVLSPLLFVGVYASLITLALNYEWAPEADLRKDSILDSMSDDEREIAAKKAYSVRAKHYRNREGRRTWFVGRIPYDLATEKLRNVEIHQQDADGNPLFSYFASKAAWNHLTGEWRLIAGRKVDNRKTDNEINKPRPFTEEIVPGWSETPWKIYSESLEPEQMGVQGLGFHMETNSDQPAKLLAPFRTHWHYRWSLPWSCFVITLAAAPLGIVFSRRGMMGGVAAAMLIFFGMLVFTNLFLALGQGMHMPAFFGAWATNIALGGLGLLLLWQRSGNRELPKLNLATVRNWFTGSASKGGRKATSRA